MSTKLNIIRILLVSILLSAISLSDTFAFSSYFNQSPMVSVDGMSNGTIYDIIRGQKGYIWFATDMGISRYDGFRFRNFPYTPQAEPANSFAQKVPKAILKLYPNNGGILYLQKKQGGMACFDIGKEAYLPIRFDQPFDENTINGLYLAEQYVLYIATTQGLYSAEVKRTKEGQQDIIQISLSKEPVVKGNISHLCGDNKGNLFCCINPRTIVHYSMGTQQTQTIPTEGNPNAEVTALYAHQEHLWICRKFEDITTYDYNRKSLRTLSGNQDGGMPLSDTFGTSITCMNDSTFYVASWSGLYCIKFENKMICDAKYSIDCITPKENINRSSLERKLTSLLWDQSQNILWVGTFGGGAIKLSFNEDVYNLIPQQWGGEINGIVEDAKGYIWLATERKGVWRSTGNTLSPTSTFSPWTSKEISNSEGYRIFKDKNGGIWLGDEKAGLIFINPITGESTYYKMKPEGTNSFTGNALQFCLDSRERLWITTTQGVVLFDYPTGKFTLVVKPEGNIHEITAIAEDKGGDIWVGTNIGVKRLEIQAKKISLIGEYEHAVGLTSNNVTFIYVNSNNQIFVSYPDKVIRIDGRKKDQIETVFTLNSGLESGHIFCMIDDSNENTWAGSNSGIMTIRNDQALFYNYSLSGYYNNVCRLHDGRLLWSDSWRLVFFDPMIVKSQQSQRQLLLSDLLVDEKTVAVGEEINGQVILHSSPDSQKCFIFDAANNDFRFYFSDMEYGMMQCKLAYRILPDEEWKMCSLEEGIHYSNLKSGSYTLQVKLVHPDAGIGKVLEVPILIKEYWWKTSWAILCYILLFVGLGCGICHLMLQKQKRRLSHIDCKVSFKEKSGQVEQEQVLIEEKHINQNIVTTRFIEELRTPLSMIIAPIREVLQEKELSKGLSTKMLVAYRNSMSMLNTCDQLLSIYSYVPKEQVELAPYSIIKLTDALVFSINEFLRVHPINFQYEKKIKKDLEIWVDKKNIELVLQNMLSNAFMHTSYSGAVAFIVQETIENGIQYCIITVRDNAKVNVKPIEELKMSLDELSRVDSSEVELGYSMMGEIMKQHHGTMSLENLKDGGVRQQIKFPITKTLFEQDTNITFINPETQEEVSLPEQIGAIEGSDSDEELMLQEEESTPGMSDTKKTILIIEDYNDIRLYLKALFEKEYNILLASNGLEGAIMAKKELPNLVISDIMMPLKDGYECCREIKEGSDTCHIPVILLTAKIEDDDIIKGLEIGADDYILKPFTPKILKAKVKNLIEGRIHLKQMYTKLLVAPSEGEPIRVGVDKADIEDPFINTVVKIIEENMQEPDFSVKKLAADLGMSQPTLYRKVKQSTDFTIIELVRGVRMRKAATLLKKKQYPVQEVVEMVGYNDIPTFRKHFVDTYGTTPSTYANSIAAEKE